MTLSTTPIDSAEKVVAELRAGTEHFTYGLEPRRYVPPTPLSLRAAALIESQSATIEKQAGLLHSNGKPRFNEAMRRAEAAEARVTALEAEKAKAIHALDLALDSDRQTDIREAIAIRAALSRSTEKNDG